MNDWPKLSGETDAQYVYRVCRSKDEIGTWTDVAGVINETLGWDKGECAYRKTWKAYQDLQQVSEVDTASTEELLESIREERRELEKARVKMRDERNEVSRLLRAKARGESMRELIERRVESYDPAEYERLDVLQCVGQGDCDLIVHLTDLHAGLHINNYCNRYNGDIMMYRLRKYAGKIAEIWRRHNAKKCYVVLGGDLVNGAIHVNSRLENNENVIDQVVSASEAVSWFVTEMSKLFLSVDVYSVPGNHSRVFPNKEDNEHGEYLDRLVTYYLQAKCAQINNIHICDTDLDGSMVRFAVRGENVFAVHGDKDTPTGVVNSLTMMTGMKPDIVLMGHRHTNGLTTVYDTKVYESGCVDGPDNYCMDKRLKNKPEQTVLVVNDLGLDCAYDVKLD